MIKLNKAFLNSFLFYSYVFVLADSPGAIAWKLFKNKKGKIPLIKRDLICDTETLNRLPSSETSLDEFTTAFSPFIPLLTLNGKSWKIRRKILLEGLRKMDFNQSFSFDTPLKKGDVYGDFFEILFRIGFELIFGRSVKPSEFDQMYPGIVDINRLIKRHIAYPTMQLRWHLYKAVVKLLSENNAKFIFSDCDAFRALDEIDRVSIIVEDLLTSICIQCTDLICHLLLLYPLHKEAFKHNLDHCINETLRLYPLTDIWTRKASPSQRGWIASLVQLNRSGWEDPDHFKPERWDRADHPPLISWGFDARACPASKIGYNLSKKIFQKIISDEKIEIILASNFNHTRTFPSGCQIWLREGKKTEDVKWTFKGKWKNQFHQWLFSRLRVIDQHELW